MDNDLFPHTQLQKGIGKLLQIVLGGLDAGQLARLQLIDDQVVCIGQAGLDQRISVRIFADQIDRGFDPLLQGSLQNLQTVPVVYLFQQQKIAQMQDLRAVFLKAHMVVAKPGAGAGIGKERPLTAGYTHNLGKARLFSGQHRQTGCIYAAMLQGFRYKSAFGIISDGTHSVDIQLRTDLFQIHRHIGHAAADRLLHTANLGQLTAFRIGGDLIDLVNDHCTGNDDAGPLLRSCHLSCTQLPADLPGPSGRTAVQPGWGCKKR